MGKWLWENTEISTTERGSTRSLPAVSNLRQDQVWSNTKNVFGARESWNILVASLKWTHNAWIEPLLLKIGALSESTSRMDLVDCTRISHASARKFVPSCATCRFPERMSQALWRKASDRSMVHRASQAKAVEVCDVPKEVASTPLVILNNCLTDYCII